jgi:hypothetical protein
MMSLDMANASPAVRAAARRALLAAMTPEQLDARRAALRAKALDVRLAAEARSAASPKPFGYNDSPSTYFDNYTEISS